MVPKMCKNAHKLNKGDENVKLDYSDLRLKIRSVYHRLEDFAKDMNISQGTLTQKLNGKSEWTRAEVEKTSVLLELSNEEIIRYFFRM